MRDRAETPLPDSCEDKIWPFGWLRVVDCILGFVTCV